MKLTLTKKQIVKIVKEQNVETGRGFYIVPVYNEQRTSTFIDSQQYWGLSKEDQLIFAKDVKRFFFFRDMSDVKEVNNIIDISI
jgi:hypothetical protein